MTEFQLSKRPAISYGSRLTKTMPKPSKISIYTCGLYIHQCNSPYFNVELFEEESLWVT